MLTAINNFESTNAINLIGLITLIIAYLGYLASEHRRFSRLIASQIYLTVLGLWDIISYFFFGSHIIIGILGCLIIIIQLVQGLSIIIHLHQDSYY